MKFLIVNMDDLGLAKAVNEAARKCCLNGSITGVSVISCAGEFREAVKMLHDIEKKEVGAHLTLTGGFSPCTEDISRIKTLLGGNGKFVKDYLSLGTRYLTKLLNLKEVRIELSNQIRKLTEAGFEITHLDSHEHVHVLPGIMDVTIQLAGEFGIPYVRSPLESGAVMKREFRGKDLLRHVALKVFVQKVKGRIPAAHLRCNDVFFGHFHSGRINDKILSFLTGSLREGVNEVAVHPSLNSRELFEKHPWYKNGPVELDALLNGKWKDTISSEGVRMVPHSEIPAC